MKTIKLYTVAIIMLLFAACEYEVVQPEKVNIPDDVTISFATDIAPIFTRCTACHSGISPVLTAGNAYNNLTSGGYIDTANAAQSRLYVKVKSGHPDPNITPNATELAKILKWIEQGAKNN